MENAENLPFAKLPKETVIEQLKPKYLSLGFIIALVAISIFLGVIIAFLFEAIVGIFELVIGWSLINTIISVLGLLIPFMIGATIGVFIASLIAHSRRRFWITNLRVISYNGNSMISAVPIQNISEILLQPRNIFTGFSSLQIAHIGGIRYNRRRPFKASPGRMNIYGLELQKAQSLQKSIAKLAEDQKKKTGNKVFLA